MTNKQSEQHNKPLMQQALGKQWEQLPAALQAHYQHTNNTDSGVLTIEYPPLMQPYLSFMRLLGALVNKRGENVPATVEKWMEGGVQRWKRSIHFPDGKTIFFKSYWVYTSGEKGASGTNRANTSELIEYVSPFMGLRMAVTVEQGELHYEGVHYVIKLGSLLLPIPEWLILGHTTIVERALNEEEFAMDFRLKHPWFGQLFRYSGTFTTE